MIKRIVAAIIAASCSLAQASDYITIGGFSFHSERRQSNGKDWNEFNPGLGFNGTCQNGGYFLPVCTETALPE